MLFTPEREQTGILDAILWGLEEEGIPVEILQAPDQAAETLAQQAADQSPLNVGIGVSRNGKEVALHHRDLPSGRSLFVLSGPSLQLGNLRRLGLNGARLVKGEPLVFEDAAGNSELSNRPVKLTEAQFEELVTRIVNELLGK